MQQWIDLLLWMGVLSVPAGGLFAIFISTLGPEKPVEQPVADRVAQCGPVHHGDHQASSVTSRWPAG